MNRRSFLRSGLAAFALTTGLARTVVQVVDGPPVWLAPIRWIGIDEARREYDYQRDYITAVMRGGAVKVVVRKGRTESLYIPPAAIYEFREDSGK